MHFSCRSEYAIHSLFYLTLRSADEPVLLQELAADQHLSSSYLAKVMQRLSGAGLVQAYVGGNGGYTLARPAREITFADAVRSVEGQVGFFNCLQQQRRCIAGPGCEIQKVFCAVTKGIPVLPDLEEPRRIAQATCRWQFTSS